jgi:DEAD/DEAH box helicase domain-containing protein
VEGSLAVFEPNLYLYDSYPGIGQSAPRRLAPRLLQQTGELLAGCGCDADCPSCVGPVGEVGERGKELAGRILAALSVSG